jgi:hypothetical protein
MTIIDGIKVEFQPSALNILTPAQKVSIVEMSQREQVVSMQVFKDFSLPDGFVAFITYYKRGQLNGGVDPLGNVST